MTATGSYEDFDSDGGTLDTSLAEGEHHITEIPQTLIMDLEVEVTQGYIAANMIWERVSRGSICYLGGVEELEKFFYISEVKGVRLAISTYPDFEFNAVTLRTDMFERGESITIRQGQVVVFSEHLPSVTNLENLEEAVRLINDEEITQEAPAVPREM